MAQTNRTFLGTEVKFLVTIEADGFDMERDDFNITLKRGGSTLVFDKTDLVHDVDSFYLCFDTKDLGSGVVTATITAYVPDNDFDDGLRTEVYKFDLMTVDK